MSAATILAAVLSLAPVNDTDADEAAFSGNDGVTRVYDFDDDSVFGETLSPDGANITSRAHVRHASMLSLRPHFIGELHRLSLDI